MLCSSAEIWGEKNQCSQFLRNNLGTKWLVYLAPAVEPSRVIWCRNGTWEQGSSLNKFSQFPDSLVSLLRPSASPYGNVSLLPVVLPLSSLGASSDTYSPQPPPPHVQIIKRIFDLMLVGELSRHQNPVGLKLQAALTSTGACESRFSGPTRRVSDSVGLGWNSRICISNRLPGDADTASPGAAL